MNGYEAGAVAGSWLIDGNTSAERAAEWVLSQCGGDDSILTNLPDSPLSGEFAGGPTPASVLADVGIDDVIDAGFEDVENELLEAFENGYRQGALEQVLQDACGMLGVRFTWKDTPAPPSVEERAAAFADADGYVEQPAEVVWEIFDVAQPERAIDTVATSGPANTIIEALRAWAKDAAEPVWENGTWVVHEAGGREMGGASMSARVAPVVEPLEAVPPAVGPVAVEPVAEEPQPHGWDIVEVGKGFEPVGKSFGVTEREALTRFALDVGMVGRVVIEEDILPTRHPEGHLEAVPVVTLSNGPLVVMARSQEREAIVWYTVPVAVTVNLRSGTISRVAVVDEEVGLVSRDELRTRPSLVWPVTLEDGMTPASAAIADAALAIAHSDDSEWPAWVVGS